MSLLSKALLPRALRIWQALLDAFDRRGYTVASDANGQTVVSVLGEPFEITLLEPQKQVFVESRWGSGRNMELHPSGRLFLRVGGSYSSSGTADNPPHLVEDRLNRFVAGLVRRAFGAKRERAIREDRERRWRIEDDRRRLEEQERASEVLRLRHLRTLAIRWVQDQRLKEFLADVERCLDSESDEDRRARGTHWLAWARQELQGRDAVEAFVEDAWPIAALPPQSYMAWSWK